MSDRNAAVQRIEGHARGKASTFSNLPIFRVDIDKEQDLAADMNIRVSPIAFFFQDGTLTDTYTWNQRDALMGSLKS